MIYFDSKNSQTVTLSRPNTNPAGRTVAGMPQSTAPTVLGKIFGGISRARSRYERGKEGTGKELLLNFFTEDLTLEPREGDLMAIVWHGESMVMEVDEVDTTEFNRVMTLKTPATVGELVQSG